MNGRALSESDIFDFACFDEVRIFKRHVYSRPALGWGASSTATIPTKVRKAQPLVHRGWLEKGLSTRSAWGEVTEAYEK